MKRPKKELSEDQKTSDTTPPSLENKLQQRVDHCLKRKGKLNSAALVSQHETIILKSIQGYADKPQSQLLTADSKFLAGSLVKQFVAVALIMGIHDQVIEEKETEQSIQSSIQSKLHKPLSNYIPAEDSIWHKGKRPPWADHVTLHQLLTHTSGLKNFEESAYPCRSSRKELDLEKLLQTPDCPLSSFVSLFKNETVYRGNSYHYANSNYLLAGYVAMKILKDTLENFFSDLFKKLDMHDTAFTSKKVGDLRKDPKLVFPHQISLERKDDEPKITCLLDDFEDMYLPWASGSLVTTAVDLLKWTHELFIGKQHIPEVVSDIIQQTKGSFVGPGQSDTRIYSSYGVLRCENALGQITCYEHNGSIYGFYGHASYFPGEEICVVELSNMRPSSTNSWKNLGGGVACEFTRVIGDHYYPTIRLKRKSCCPDLFKNKKAKEQSTTQNESSHKWSCTIL